VKNLFGLQNVYLKAFMTRLTPVVRTRLFLKLTFPDKNRLTALHSFTNKESCFVLWEMHEGVVALIHFVVVTNGTGHFKKC
jgi:hypothetical protein